MRAKCLAQEHNTMSPARARTRTARSGDERTDDWSCLHYLVDRIKNLFLKIESSDRTVVNL